MSSADAPPPPRPAHVVPFFDDLAVGETLTTPPAVTLTDGHAAVHAAILGDRLRLPLDATLAEAVVGAAPSAHPGLVCDIAIGQTTALTQRVVGNLFYRGLLLHRPVAIGDTLRTTTTVEALRANRSRPGRAPTGLAVLRIRTVDQRQRPVLDFRRCAMLPARDELPPPPADAPPVSDGLPERLDHGALTAAAAHWDVAAFRRAVPGAGRGHDLRPGLRLDVSGGDVVSSAPELARITLNVATVHHDATVADGRRLVYGGHTIGIAAGQLSRVLPDLVTILGWERCDHLGPVHEGDTLHSAVTVERAQPTDDEGTLLGLRSQVTATAVGADPRPVLDWRLVALAA